MKYLIRLLFICQFFFILSPVSASVYEASTLHNAVSRSETVQDLFNARWEEILERNLYFDIYGKINWVRDFQVNSYNSGTGEKEPVEMTLVRAYSSVTFNFPIFGKFDPGSRFSIPDKKKKSAPESEGEEKDESLVSSLWKENNLLIGFTMTGFHYGLTRKTEVDRGSAGKETATDYKYTQFFDDIYAISLLYVPYVYIHVGLIVNNAIEPNDDGTITYNSSEGRKRKLFVSSNVLSFLNVNAATTADKMESSSMEIGLNELIENFTDPFPAIMPKFKIRYKYINLYGDQAYDSVWVGSEYQSDNSVKTAFMDDDEREEANLQTIRISIAENLLNILYIDFSSEYQRVSDDIYDKMENDEISVKKIKEMRGMVGIDFFGFSKNSLNKLILSYGMSKYWDPAIAIHRDSGNSLSVTGWILMLDWSIPWGGAQLKMNRNYSDELKKLLEATDKTCYEASIYFRF